MIHIVCGMIGAGKSTFCKGKVAVSDFYGEVTCKTEQVNRTFELMKAHSHVWHITTYPCRLEEEAFKNCEKEYIWINTSFSQCKENILKRKRERDLKNFHETMIRNKEIQILYLRSKIQFKVVNVFEEEEKW